jgi:hypothetical protein
MANKQQKIAQKKKKREKIAKERVLRRREQMRAVRKEDERKARLERELSPRQMPIVNDPLVREMREKSRADAAKAQIEKNLELLKAIEEEYDKEHALREQVNKDLESEGHVSMKDKLDALHQKAMAMKAQKEEEKPSEE